MRQHDNLRFLVIFVFFQNRFEPFDVFGVEIIGNISSETLDQPVIVDATLDFGLGTRRNATPQSCTDTHVISNLEHFVIHEYNVVQLHLVDFMFDESVGFTNLCPIIFMISGQKKNCEELLAHVL